MKWWRLDPKAARTDLTFSYDEALALYLGRRYLAPLSGSHLWTAAHRAFQKVRASLGETALNYLERIGDAFHDSTFGITDYSTKAEILDRLMIGIEDHRVVFITYRSDRAAEPVTYDVHPYRFTLHKGSLYLQG